MMPRQCTVDFKIVPVKQTARRMVMESLGLEYLQKIPDDIGFIIDIGFSYDEIRRINLYQSPQFKYMYLAYPLVEENLSTADSICFLEQNEFPNKRSRCYLCPFNCDGDRDIGMDWDEIIREEPLSFLKACWFDEQLRKVQPTKVMRTIPYLHYSRTPLVDVFQRQYEEVRHKYAGDITAWLKEWERSINKKYSEIA